MTQFRPGQRVKVVDAQDWTWQHAIGVVCGIHEDGSVAVDLADCGGVGHVWFHPSELAFIPEPGIPAHLVRTGTDLPSRHWPVWRA